MNHYETQIETLTDIIKELKEYNAVLEGDLADMKMVLNATEWSNKNLTAIKVLEYIIPLALAGAHSATEYFDAGRVLYSTDDKGIEKEITLDYVTEALKVLNRWRNR